MTVRRATMKFLVPVSVTGIKSETLSGRRLIPCYISPTEFSVDEKKIITQTLTKGGYFIEYWGEELPTITARGTTGSGGIEAIEILRAVYRNEQIQMSNLLRERSRELSQEHNLASQNTATAIAGGINALDTLFGEGFSEILDGSKSIIEQMSEIFSDDIEEINPVSFIPSLGTFAVSVDLYLQGLKYRGYFTDFRYNENGESPGIFEYNFTFKVLRRSGRRKNFMPWHRNPYDANGNPTEASIPIEGARIDELSYKSNLENSNSIFATEGFSQFSGNQNNPQFPEPNEVGVSRFKKVQS